MTRFILLFVIVIFTNGCSTRSLPQTTLDNKKISLPEIYKNTPVYFSGFDSNGTEVDVSHYDGILQTKQFWFAAPTKEQKNLLKDAAFSLINIGFASEIISQGLHIENENTNATDLSKGIRINGHIQKILIKTYGDGFGGYGSAGDYWEAYLYLDKLEVIFLDTKTTKHIAPIQSYAKINGTPIKLGSFTDGLIFAAKLASLAFTTLPQLAYDSSNIVIPPYKLDNTKQAPIEIAAKISARAFLDEISK
jgi:hypothetical protein